MLTSPLCAYRVSGVIATEDRLRSTPEPGRGRRIVQPRLVLTGCPRAASTPGKCPDQRPFIFGRRSTDRRLPARLESVLTCPNCGEENPPRFRLCGFCGTPLVAELPAQEVRKTVSIVFSDLKGSTSLGESVDSEALREVLGRYFDEMRAVLELHGGRVEKYIGDAIMAVFGLPNVHEDDALRAVRAAAEMKTALARLNDELHERWGVRLENRTGVNTGE